MKTFLTYLLYLNVGLICLFVLYLVVICIKGYMEVERDKENYDKSLFKQLKFFNPYLRNSEEPILIAFRNISNKILQLDENAHHKYSNMYLIDSMAYHEIIALRTVIGSINSGVSIDNEEILNLLKEITIGLEAHYQHFCDIKTTDVRVETLILKTLQQKEKERTHLEVF